MSGERLDRRLGEAAHRRLVKFGAQPGQRRAADRGYGEQGSVFPGQGELDVGVQDRTSAPPRPQTSQRIARRAEFSWVTVWQTRTRASLDMPSMVPCRPARARAACHSS
ncbi:MAG TPA: hypothetical protein VMK84_24045 [Streptosporangiaceae bacterium]|nr:hypothetical protein [Streptosporangiaceae bacterium]